MKFGNQVLSKSVPEWKLHNIDYEKLKKCIKKATTASTTEQNEKNLNRCTDVFKDQFEAINLFVSLKVKEISSKLMTTEKSLINFKKKPNNSANKRLQLRQLKLISNHVDGCSTELQRLSRYLIIQKIALRKLFKKFVKHYPYGKENAQMYVAHIENSQELNNGYEGISFIKVDLDPYLLEISLIADILVDLQEKISNDEAHELPSTSSKKNINSSMAFDISFLGKYQKVQSFLISSENAEEFKFMILNLGFHMLDDEIISTSRDIQDNAENISSLDSKSIKSAKSFLGLQHIVSQKQLQQQAQEDQGQNPRLGTTNKPNSLKSVNKSINTGQPAIASIVPVQARLSQIILDNSSTPSLLHDESVNQHPNLIMVSKQDQSHCLLMCHVGGIRDHFVTSNILYDDLAKCIRGEDVDFKQKIHDFTPIDKLAIEWLQARHLRPLDPEISFKRTRFICSNSDVTYLIALDEEISIDSTSMIPHAIVEIKKLNHNPNNSSTKIVNSNMAVRSKTKPEKLAELCDALIEQNLQCYPIPAHDTIWKLSYQLQHSNNLQADLFAILLKDKYEIEEDDSLNAEEFFMLGKDDILTMCSEKFRDKLHKEGQTHRMSVISVRQKNTTPHNTETPRVRYWNEFDDDPEFFNDNGFYIDESTDSDHQINGKNGKNDYGLVRFNRNFINTTFRACQRIRVLLGLQEQSIPQALAAGVGYGSISAASVSTVSNEDYQAYVRAEDQEMDNDDSVYEYRHDQVITFMYLSMLLISCVTSGISLGIVLALFNRGDTDAELEVAEVLELLICGTLILSLVLICSSLLLLFSRFKLAPTWHYISCFVLFLVVIFTVCYGLIAIFF